MFKKIDSYIIKKFLGTFFYTILLISMIAIVIDFSEKVENLLAPEVSLYSLIFEYYLNFIPWINGLLWPLFALLSVIFFTSRLAKDNEIIAILSSGISYKRFLVPYIISAFILAGMLWIGNNYIIPKSTKIKNDFESTYINKSAQKVVGYNSHFFLSPTEKVFLRYYRSNDSTGQTFRYEKFNANSDLIYMIKAAKLTLKEDPNLWTLHDYEKRSFNGMKETLEQGVGKTMDTLLALTPDDFIRNAKVMENMTSTDLKEFINIERERGLGTAQAMLVELHRRSADPFTIIILTLMGVALASRKVRGGLGIHLALGVILGALFVLVSKFSITISTNLSINTTIGMWLPNALFTILAFFLLFKAQK
jgi:lipopolysaccharide export system permease protein